MNEAHDRQGQASAPTGAEASTEPTLAPTPHGFTRRGEDHLIISGAIHYFRVHPEQWRDRLRRLVAMGCNTVETYVAWNMHEPREGQFVFDGTADLGRFLRTAQEEGLDAIVRPGPYICAEWDNGGLPGWILRDRSMTLRAFEPRYLAKVDAYFDVLIPLLARHQASNGGNVVMVQVENEYGSFRDDRRYLEHIRDGLTRRGITELLVTSDGPGPEWLSGGTIDGALATVNFGSRTLEVLDGAREWLPEQPLMCMEFWNGWFDHWGEQHHVRSAESAASELRDMLTHGMSVNFYMAHGGTNFGLTAGANHDGTYQPTVTSYDYDAPIAENGALTDKFRAFREVISEFRDLPPLAEHLAQLGLDVAPASVGPRHCTVASTTSLRGTSLTSRAGLGLFPVPPAFEDVGLERGVMRLWRNVELTPNRWEADGSLGDLRLYGLRDRAWVFIDGLFAGVAERPDEGEKEPRIPLGPLTKQLLPDGEPRTVRLEILVESLGRVNFGPSFGDRKGILGGVWFMTRFLSDWHVDVWPLEDMAEELAACAGGAVGSGAEGFCAVGSGAEGSGAQGSGAQGSGTEGRGKADSVSWPDAMPLLLTATFDAEGKADAFLALPGAGHGVAYVNGFCVGRYWDRGPQESLYVPAPVVREGVNDVFVLEFEQMPERIELVEGPRLGAVESTAG